MNEEEKAKMTKLMRFWLFGTFIIIFAATTVYTGGAVGLGLLIMRQPGYWLAMGITAVLCVVMYYVYQAWLKRK